MEDEQIIGPFFRRAEEAILRTREKYGGRCSAAARRILTDDRDVEECVSDACLRAWNAIPPERPHALGAWLVRVTRNLALDRYAYNRAAQRSTALTEAFEELEVCLPLAQDGPEQVLEGQALREFLNDFLRRQTQEARTFFIRRYWYGESVAEIAQACAVSQGKIKSSLFRTRNRLREALEKEGVTV